MFSTRPDTGLVDTCRLSSVLYLRVAVPPSLPPLWKARVHITHKEGATMHTNI